MAASDETRNMTNAAAEARENFRAISDILAANLATTKKSAEVMDDITKKMKGQISLEDQLNILEAEKQEYLKEQLSKGAIINKDLVKKLDLSIDLLRKEKQRTDLQGQLKDDLKESLGMNNKYVQAFKTGGAAALGFAAMSFAVQQIAQGIKNTVGYAFDLYKTQGLSSGEAAKTAVEVQKARIGMEGMLSSAEDFNKAATGIIEQFGSLSNVSGDTLENVTNLQRYLGDTSGAIKLNALLSSGGKDAAGMTDQIERLSREAGVGAAGVMADLAGNAAKLYGASEQETLELIKQSVLLRQNGVSLEKAKSIADGMLDIESSLKAEMKARIALGKDVNLSQARNLAMQGKYGEMMEEINKQFGDISDFASRSVPEQRMIAQAVGMSTDEFAEYAAMNDKVGQLTGQMADETAEATAKQGDYTKALATYGPVLASLIPTIGMMIMQQKMLKKVGAAGAGKGDMISNMASGGGKAMTSLLKGAAAMLIIAAAIYVLGKAFQQFGDITWPNVFIGLGALAAFSALAIGLGAIGPMVLIGAASMLVLSSAVLVLGLGFQALSKGLEPLQQMGGLMSLAPGIAALGLSLIPLAMGLAAIMPVLPALLALGAVGMMVGFGAGDGEGGGGSDPSLLEEIKGLRADLQSQPIQVVFDGKVVSEITRKQSQQSSLRRATK